MNGFKKELTDTILSFWTNHMQDEAHGGFYGRIDGNNQCHPEANKGAIMHARILWTFSAACRLLDRQEYAVVAQRAFDYIQAAFIDETYGGVYWEVDYRGEPVNTRKQLYAQGFMLYGFTEFYRATGNTRALELAKEFFTLIENCRDRQLGGYFEAYTREWQPIEDMRLSPKDANEKKTMNTHLHILEPYTNLLRVWRDEKVYQALCELVGVFTNRILNPATAHLNLFFDEAWQVRSSELSYGHDIEASWLLYEAALELGDQGLLQQIIPLSLRIADAAAEGLEPDGSMIYEKLPGRHTDTTRHWWVQAEAVVGFMYAWKNSGNPAYREKAASLWSYIRNHITDREAGEWFWSCQADGRINRTDDKAGFWKCPYHNGRMCMEMIEHFGLE